MSEKKDAFTIHHVTDRIFLFLFDDMFDMCMHFLRYQEFYESPKFNNQPFTIIDFMEWYSKTLGNGVFTYTGSWAGFNIPSTVIWQVHCNKISDFNKYDAAMLAAFNKISANTHKFAGAVKHDNFYIIGVCKKSFDVIDHEMAHGLYFLNPKFRKEMRGLTKKLPKSVIKSTHKYLAEVGYMSGVFDDELQAYFSTGLPKELKQCKKYTKQFIDVYYNYTKDIAFDLQKSKPL